MNNCRKNLHITHYSIFYYTGHGPGRAEGPAGCGHSKIASVCAYWVAASNLYVLYVVDAAD